MNMTEMDILVSKGILVLIATRFVESNTGPFVGKALPLKSDVRSDESKIHSNVHSDRKSRISATLARQHLRREGRIRT